MTHPLCCTLAAISGDIKEYCGVMYATLRQAGRFSFFYICSRLPSREASWTRISAHELLRNVLTPTPARYGNESPAPARRWVVPRPTRWSHSLLEWLTHTETLGCELNLLPYKYKYGFKSCVRKWAILKDGKFHKLVFSVVGVDVSCFCDFCAGSVLKEEPPETLKTT